MVCYSHSTSRFQQGSGAIDTLMRPFIAEKFAGERHAYSLSPTTFLKPMNFMGPHTRLDLRLDKNEQPLPSSTPVNKSDYNSYIHDLKYKHAKEDYLKDPTPENKKRQMQKIWQADDNFIRDMNNDQEEPVAKVAGNLI